MPAELFEPPYLGIDSESAPDAVTKSHAPDVTNVLTGHQGRLPIRGPLDVVSQQLWAFETTAQIWAYNDGWFVVSRPGNTEVQLVTATNFLLARTISDSTEIPTGDHVAVGDDIFGISSTGAFIQVQDHNFFTPIKFIHAPTNGYAVTYWKNRFWYLGGKLIGDVAARKDQIGWSDQHDGTDKLPDADATWQDDVSGLTNRIVFDDIGSSNLPVGLGRLPNGLVVFGTYTTTLLQGTEPSNLTMRPRAVAHGCIDRRSIVEFGDAVLWLAREGFYYYDGVQEIELSQQIRSELRAAINRESVASAVLVADDYVMLSVGNVQTPTTWLLHLPTRSWSTFLSPVLQGGGPRLVSPRGQNGLGLIYDGSNFWPLTNVVRPGDVPASLGQDKTSAGSNTPFVSTVTSPVALLGEPQVKSHVTRLMVDTLGDGWSASLQDGAGNSVAASAALTSSGGLARSRTVRDVFAETNDLQLAIQRQGAGGSVVPELRRAWVEYQLAQKTYSH